PLARPRIDALRRRVRVGVLEEEELRFGTAAQHARPRLEEEVRLVPVVDPAEEDERAFRRHVEQTPAGAAVSSRRVSGYAEGNDREKPGQRRIRRKVPRPDSSRGVERARIEQPLLRRGTEEEVRPGERERKGRAVVHGGRFPQRRGVMEVLDEER